MPLYSLPFVFLLIVLLSCTTGSEHSTHLCSDSIPSPIQSLPIVNTGGFFLDDWQPKTFTTPSYVPSDIPTTTNQTVTVDASEIITRIPLSLFGVNSGWWNNALDPGILRSVRSLHPHIIRFPGGSSSNLYFWNASKTNPPQDIPAHLPETKGMLKHTYVYGQSSDVWALTLDKYYTLLQKAQAEGMITVNYSYARYGTSSNPVATAAHLAAEWVRHDNGRTKYWEIGNENYGNWEAGYLIDTTVNRDGQPQLQTGALYGKHFRVFADSMQKAARETGHRIYIGAVIYPEPATEHWQTKTTRTWNKEVLKEAEDKSDFYIVHHYFTPMKDLDASTILTTARTSPEKIMQFVTQGLHRNNRKIKPLALSEWNMFAKGRKQSVSNVSGLFAAIVMGEIIKNRYGMAAYWALTNEDLGLLSSEQKSGIPLWAPQPAFYYMYFFERMLGDQLLKSTVSHKDPLQVYASSFTSGEINVNLINTFATSQPVEVKINHYPVGSRFYWYSLAGGTDHKDFSRQVFVNGKGPKGPISGPVSYQTLPAQSTETTQGIKVIVPAYGAVFLVVDRK
ncbi:hypothetical protein [Xanthocytophaga flava]|uniref:hypothetical protein n=1 Tax=Xanthocytophaga flava TaxID=3048013 RepID=UPI0028D1BF12|nr:hypothetical protein [Xanthocytophaga flavus]MDJ1470863.1 hypothetical protein [Xanthocytophaga flavus]